MARRFTEVTARQASQTLARRFVPLADSLRDMLTKFGLRTYRVSMVRIAWSGSRRGYGVASVVSEEVMLPTPKITPIDSLAQIIQPVGGQELGQLELSGISGRYTEEKLLGTSEDGTPIPSNEEFFYEIEFFPHTEGPSIKRRFIPRAPAGYNPGRLQWTLKLERSFDQRERNGDVEGP